MCCRAILQSLLRQLVVRNVLVVTVLWHTEEQSAVSLPTEVSQFRCLWTDRLLKAVFDN